jgi:type II secretion system protein G
MRKIIIGFTLIELLIVVAIIAILAAIAIPNFLEAHVRSKVSRAKADLRSITTALEAYHVDYNHYPPNPNRNPGPNHGSNVTPWQLTTPSPFITTRPTDPFKEGKDMKQTTKAYSREERFYYDYYSIITYDEFVKFNEAGIEIFPLAVDDDNGSVPGANRGAFKKYGSWLQWSTGPDALLWFDDVDPNTGMLSTTPIYRPWGYSFDVPYDPTNGTVSFGNIIRSQVKPDGLQAYCP